MNKNTIRILSFLLAALCTLAFCSCGKKSSGSSSGSDSTATTTVKLLSDSVPVLPYSKEDGINPLKGVTVLTKSIAPLMYEGLYVLTSSCRPVKSIAASGSSKGTTVTVTIDHSKTFSDGTSINADDVVYSFGLAKASVLYGSYLGNISSAAASGTSQVVFTLGVPDRDALALLSFPIVKSGTADANTSVPVGYGMYVYTQTDSGYELKYNTAYDTDKTVKNKTVGLSDISDTSAISFSLEIGNINAYYDDLAGGTVSRVSADTSYVPINSIIYIGINPSNITLADPTVKKYLSALLDRDAILNEGYGGYADATDLPFAPGWYRRKSITAENKVSTKTAEKLIKTDSANRTFTLLTDSDNTLKTQLAEKLVSEFADLGMTVTVNAVPYAQYTADVASGTYDMYIGEMKLGYDMDIRPLLSADNPLYTNWMDYMSGTTSLNQFVKLWYTNLPFITLGCRTGVLAYSRNISGDVVSYENNVYSNVYEWTFSEND